MTNPDRREVLVGAGAAGAAAGALAILSALGSPVNGATIAPPDSDAGLWELRRQWLAATAAHDAALKAHSPVEHAFFARCVPYPPPSLHPSYVAACAAVDEAREALKVSLGLDVAEAACEAALDVYGAVVDAITATPARTFPGIALKAEVSIAQDNLDPDLLDSLMADIAAIAAAHPWHPQSPSSPAPSLPRTEETRS